MGDNSIGKFLPILTEKECGACGILYPRKEFIMPDRTWHWTRDCSACREMLGWWRYDFKWKTRWNVYGMYCTFCKTILDRNIAHLDHILPRSRGGTDDPWNLQFLCSSCNLKKGRKTEGELILQLQLTLPSVVRSTSDPDEH